MSKDLDFEFTVDDFDRMVLEALEDDEGVEKKPKTTRPNFLEMLRTGGQLGKLNTENNERI